MAQAAELETEHVHKVYDVIAEHFSHTRYKPWPVVERFVMQMPVGSIMLDVGCGNGKYLNLNPNSYLVGSDRCFQFASICRQRSFEALRADNLVLPFRSGVADFAISIAVIHHFATPERRLQALKEIFRTLKVGGQMLVTVWALEQEKKKFTEQDVMVPWHLTKAFQSDSNALPHAVKKTHKANELIQYNRYYHLFKEGELADLAKQLGSSARIVDHAYDCENWYCFVEKLCDSPSDT